MAAVMASAPADDIMDIDIDMGDDFVEPEHVANLPELEVRTSRKHELVFSPTYEA